MDDALQIRLDAIVGLLAVVVLLLAAVVAALGGGKLLVSCALAAFVVVALGWFAREVNADRRATRESIDDES